jgi:hypothetical protein
MQPEWLYKVIQFESGWNPTQRAYEPLNAAQIAADPSIAPVYAEGLIQFTPDTARSLGFADAHDLVTQFPDAESQLSNPVFNYFKQYAPFPTAQSVYLTVFYPAARNWAPDKQFPDSVKASNPGINTPQDYVNFVERIKIPPVAMAGAIILLLAASVFIYLIATKKIQLPFA